MSDCEGGQIGTVRLFPLGGVVLFPCALVPLHIFEPRYRQMTEDALADDRAIALVLPKPMTASERAAVELGGKPPIHAVGCVGDICHETRLPDGRFTFILQGRRRFRILEELPNDRLYRTARVQYLSNATSADSVARRQLQKMELLMLVHRLLPNSDADAEKFYEFLKDRCADDVFADTLAYASPLAVSQKQRLLETNALEDRLELLLNCLRESLGAAPPQRTPEFPPAFSQN